MNLLHEVLNNFARFSPLFGGEFWAFFLGKNRKNGRKLAQYVCAYLVTSGTRRILYDIHASKLRLLYEHLEEFLWKEAWNDRGSPRCCQHLKNGHKIVTPILKASQNVPQVLVDFETVNESYKCNW